MIATAVQAIKNPPERFGLGRANDLFLFKNSYRSVSPQAMGATTNVEHEAPGTCVLEFMVRHFNM